MGCGSSVAFAGAFTGPAGALACGAAGVLAADRVGRDDGPGFGVFGCVVAGRNSLVPSRWRDAADQFGRAHGPLPVVAERGEIALLHVQRFGVREIVRRIGRHPGTVSRELRRNAATRSGKQVFRELVAQRKSQQAAKRPKTAKLVTNERLRVYAQERLDGSIRRSDGTIVAGPWTRAWKGLNKPHRQNRRWAIAIREVFRLVYPAENTVQKTS